MKWTISELKEVELCGALSRPCRVIIVIKEIRKPHFPLSVLSDTSCLLLGFAARKHSTHKHNCLFVDIWSHIYTWGGLLRFRMVHDSFILFFHRHTCSRDLSVSSNLPLQQCVQYISIIPYKARQFKVLYVRYALKQHFNDVMKR